MRKYSSLLISCLALTLCSLAHSQIIAWNTNGQDGDEASFAAQTLDSNLAATTLTRGAGISASGLSNSFNSNSFDSSNLSDAITANEYLTFSVTPNSGYQVSLSTLDVSFRRSSTGPNAFQWVYSLDSFATEGVNIGSEISYTSTTTNGTDQTQINLSGISALQSITGTAMFRLYAYGASGTSGSFAIGRAGSDLAIGGSLTAVPEPSTYAAILGMITLASVMTVRRRQKRTT